MRKTVVLPAMSVVVLACCLLQSEAHAQQATTAVNFNPLRDAYYGDLHLHTNYSFDVNITRASLTPNEAYQFARGEPVNFLGEEIKRSTPLLDFLAVTDHSENIGVLNTLDDPNSPLSQSGFGQQVRKEGLKFFGRILLRLFDGVGYLSNVADVKPEVVNSATQAAWRREIEAANRNYQPGKFTTFIGYEWTSQPGMQNLHRCVIFEGNDAPNPFSATDSQRPEDLWNYLEQIRKQGYEAIAIPHNANASNGLMFDWMDSNGRSIDQAYAERRSAHEPLFEIVQEKGQSETHPILSPNDEFADFEIMDFLQGSRKGHSTHLEGSYIRDALGRGMEIAQRTGGVDPFKYGFVGDSDLHNGMSESSESASAETNIKASALKKSERFKAFSEGVEEEAKVSLPADAASFIGEYDLGSPGLTGVWAESNTRESIFAALRRKETFATSGTRLKFRFFGSWAYRTNLLKMTDWLKAAYRGGVPMGGDLPPSPVGRRAPRFAIWAVKDPDGGNLDRLQIVKVWLAGGKHVEKIYDVALSNGREVDLMTDKAPAVGNTVDLRSAKYTNTIGATELSAVWQDPQFDSRAPAVYYLRVLEIPTPRWSTIASVERGQSLQAKVPATIQERGWSSPIWYTPAAR